MLPDAQTQSPRFKVIAGYKFFSLENPLAIRFPLRDLCKDLGLKGTILLSKEGVNSFLSGPSDSIETFKIQAVEKFGLPPMLYKESFSWRQPFKRMLVKVKKEIISMGFQDINPSEFTGPSLSPTDFRNWLDEKKEMTVLDTRNYYEVKLGKFKNAVDLNVRSFREFARKAADLPDEMKKKPLVMYCTGGIRCEKASALLLKKYGFKEVYQLDGGILNYFKDEGDKYFEGECMVFDHRVGIKGDAEATESSQCFMCDTKLSFEEIKSADYIPFKYCPHCKPALQAQTN